jgi:hypothetical protein
LRGPFLKSEAFRFPLHLNLRDHHGQADPAEALERHARQLGFSFPSHVVRAWRSGVADLILDGFDELGSVGWTGSTKRMANVRFASMALIRRFVQETPEGSSVVIAGRAHYFDGPKEMSSALGMTSEFRSLTLSEFTEEQIRKYLRRHGYGDVLPAWIPARPLLLAYLGANGFLEEAFAIKDDLTPAESWDELLDRICEREAAVDAGIDGLADRSNDYRAVGERCTA